MPKENNWEFVNWAEIYADGSRYVITHKERLISWYGVGVFVDNKTGEFKFFDKNRVIERGKENIIKSLG